MLPGMNQISTSASGTNAATRWFITTPFTAGKTQAPDTESGRADWTLTGFSDVRFLLNVRFHMIGPQIPQKGQRTLDL